MYEKRKNSERYIVWIIFHMKKIRFFEPVYHQNINEIYEQN